MIFQRKFNAREKVLLCILAVIIVAGIYYFFVQLPVSRTISSATAEKAALEEELLALEILQVRYDKMTQELAEVGDMPQVETPEYDNLLRLMAFLNGALAPTDEYDLSFDSIETAENGIIRRKVNMTFTASNYRTARNVVKALQNCPYRCVISDMQFEPVKEKGTETAFLAEGKLQVTMTVTYFEQNYNI